MIKYRSQLVAYKPAKPKLVAQNSKGGQIIAKLKNRHAAPPCNEMESSIYTHERENIAYFIVYFIHFNYVN